MKTIIFDMDGTLANVEHRIKFVRTPQPDWDAFHQAMGEDVPNAPIVHLYKTLWAVEKHELIILTGRHEGYRKPTEKWLRMHGIPFCEIMMRAEHDFRADYIVKEEMLQTLLTRGKNILFAVDDRQQVVDMWRRNGITCLQCDEGDF